MQPIRAIVAHGSASERARLTEMLRADPQLAVIGEATNVNHAVAMTKQHRPNVIAIGIDLPAAGGLAATNSIMIEAPTPIVIVADEGDAIQSQMSVSALRAGALAVIPMPWTSRRSNLSRATHHFVSTIKALSQVKVIHHRQKWKPSMAPARLTSRTKTRTRVVAVAASTGGPAALQELLSSLPADFQAPILVVQHMAPGFIQGLAAQFDAVCSLDVRVAVHGEPLPPQTVLMAPDGKHLGVSDRSRVVLSNDDPVNGFRPSATILFESVAKAFGASAAHVILTGMGRDGVAGLAIARRLGGWVLAQDQASSVVFGMPGEAVSAGVVDSVVPLTSIADELVALAQR